MRFVLLIVLLAPWVSRGDDSLFQPSVRSPRFGEIIYFLLPDRFNDGDPSNNIGGRSATRMRVDLIRLTRTFSMAVICKE